MYNNNMQGQGWGRPMQPQMTGYPQQQQQQQQQQQPSSGFLQPQQTGYPGMSQFQRPMQTGFGFQQQPQPQGLAPQQTGMMGGGIGMQQMRPQATSNYLSPGPTGGMGMGMGMGMGGGLQPQPTGYMGGLQPQQTGFMGGGGLQMQQTGLMPQMTGMPIRDPRMQLMSAQFLPASQPFSGAPVAGNMNFSQTSMQPSNFQSQIQNLSQQQQGSKEPRIPWALSKEERKSYDSIFRAWDAKGTGFINGEVAREVFGQSGLETEKLMQIWHLADTGNRGKLNINEFHVAMGLIYRALNGNDIPETLPSELIPPSAKDLNDSVDFLKDLLKKDTNVRHSTGLNIPEAGSNSGASYSKARSFHENPVAPKKDATAYKHDDADVPSYKSSSRHLDRKTVRYEGQSATDDLSEMKRQLENTQKMLDKQGVEDDEDRELEREMDDLRYRIRRVQDDIEYYNRRGGRDSADLRRKAERELMHLMHERLPQLEKRLEAKESRQRDRKLGESRERDRRNDPYGRYSSASDDRDRLRDDDRGNSRSGSALGDGEYLRGTFERDSDRRRDEGASRDRYDDRDSYRRRDDDRERDSGRSAPSSSQAPPPPPPPVEAAKPVASPAPSTPAASSGPPKNMSAEERAAWIRSEAQRRVQERMRMLGAVAPAGPTPVDTSVEERLKAEQAEAAAKSAQADQEAAAREEARKARLEEHRLQTEKASLATVKQEIKEAEKADNPPPAPIVQAAKEEINDQEDMIRRREEVLAKEKADREARLRKLEEQEEEARKQEEAFKERQSMFSSGGKAASSALPPPSRKSGKGAAPPPPPPSRSRAAPAPAAAAPAAPAPSATLAPPEAPPAPAQPSPTPSASSSTNPFHRMGAGGAAAAVTSPPTAAAAATPGGTNPFFRSQQAAADSGLPPATRATPPVSAQPTGVTPSSASRTIHTAPKHDDDDWEDSDKDDDDDDADGPGSSTRATRQNLAQALFSNLIPSSGRSTPPAASAPSAPAPPPAPPAAPGAPPAPAAPAAPVIKPAAGPVDRGALLGQIQGGLKLKKAQTNDRSKALVTGSVIGDASPPVQKFVPPPSPSAAPEAPVASSAVAERSVDEAADGSAPPPPPPPPAPPAPSMPGSFDAGAATGDFAAGNPNRQSVDWANSLANDQANTKAAAFIPDEPSVREEAEEDSEDEDEGPEDLDAARKPANGHAAAAGGDEVEGFDLSHTVRVRTLYGYAGQRDEDLNFEENDVLLAHPATDKDSAWWYGSLAGGSKKGFFPRSYVEPIDKPAKAKALYDYSGASSEEATFSEGDELHVVDQEDTNWWRVDVGGPKILVAPATYLELLSERDDATKADHGKQAEAQARAQASAHAHEDSDGGSGVMVRLQSQDSAPESSQRTAPKSADWVLVDEDLPRSLSSSTVKIQPLSPSPNTADDGVAANNDDDEEVQLAAALEASQKDQREREVDRMREDRQIQRAIEASKMEAVAYALGSMDGGVAGSAAIGSGGRGEIVEEESDDSDSTTGWTSSDDDDEEEAEADVGAAEEDVTPHTEAEIRQHTIERLRVLEAAGVLVKADDTSADPTTTGAGSSNDESRDRSEDVGASESKPVRRPPPPPGQKRHKNIDELMMLSRSRTGKRPTKPEEPQRRKPPHRPRKKPSRDLPPVPADIASSQSATGEQADTAPEDRMEDAYDRYLKLTKEVSLQPILPATASGAASAKNAMIPPSSPPPFAPGSPARPSSAAGESSSRTSGFLSTIKSMSHRSGWSGSSGPTQRPDSGIGSRIVSGPIAMGSANTSGGLLQPASISEPQRVSGESSDSATDTAGAAARAGAPSWSSLVGPNILSGLSDTERKRQEAIFELISTETAHVRDLQIIVEVFFNSMQSMLSDKASTVIFANIESVLFTAVTYLSDLEARQKEDRLFVTTIGDVLERHMPAMSVYLPYCVNQQSASEILEAERKRDTRVDIHLLNLRTNHPAARGLDLSHFLLVPMQRLTRYPLLLGQILRYTPEDHADYARVKAAKETAEGILAKTNEAIREHEDATALSKLSENLWLGEEAKLDLTKPFIDPAQPGVKRHRRVLRDEMVAKSKSGRKLRLVLTTDLLLVLHAQDGSLYRMPIPVHEVKAQEAKSKSARHGDAFNVVHSMPSVAGAAVQADTIKLRAANARNAQAWIRVINGARADAPGGKA
ncbi:related to Intersectin 1 [Ustilago trichophora]|uniref:Actin cytoskeleton-regulatory complex protein PAN1 n=1 Tax=Ustilago trichophora TaxID=86804 RepID=A0A5C3EPF9_9BASI|nr:related to Intersectin 1 [Ustilago trichophora]